MLKYDKHCKIYKFDYGNSLKFVASFLYQLLANLGICIWLILLFYIVLFKNAERIINNNIFKMVLLIIFTVVFVLLITFFIIIPILPKKVILTHYGIKVYRNSLPLVDPIRGFNDYIVYSMIVSCKLYEGKIRAGKNLPVIFFNWDSLVEIKDVRNRRYFVPVKNADNFIDEVNIRRKDKACR